LSKEVKTSTMRGNAISSTRCARAPPAALKSVSLRKPSVAKDLVSTARLPGSESRSPPGETKGGASPKMSAVACLARASRSGALMQRKCA